MKKEIKVCDVCGSEKDVHSLQMPVLRKYDATEGKTFYQPMKLVLRAIDLCEDCLRKSTNIIDLTVMGYGEVKIVENKELNAPQICKGA